MAGIGKAIKGLGLLAKKYKKAVSEKASVQIGKRNIESKKLLEKARARSKEKASEINLKKIHDKYFDKSGEMKQKGKDIVKEGLKGLKK